MNITVLRRIRFHHSSAPSINPENIDLQRPENCTLPTEKDSKTVEFVTHSKERLPHEWCSGENDTRMALTYELQPVWTVVVSGEDKQVCIVTRLQLCYNDTLCFTLHFPPRMRKVTY